MSLSASVCFVLGQGSWTPSNDVRKCVGISVREGMTQESPRLWLGCFWVLKAFCSNRVGLSCSGIAERLERTGISNLSQATFGEARRSFADCSQAASYRKILKELDVQWLCFRFQRFSGFASWQWFCHAARHGRICDGLLDLGVELKEARCSRRILMWHLRVSKSRLNLRQPLWAKGPLWDGP